jgi:hypothetical protein
MKTSLSQATGLNLDVDPSGSQFALRLQNGKKTAQILGVSGAYLSAVKRAMGMSGTWMDPAAIRSWILAHPDFRVSDVYPLRKGGRHAN